MTLEEKLTALLAALCPRTYCDFAPTDTARPYVTFQQIGGQALSFMDRSVPSKENALVQVTVWADSRPAAKALAKQIEAALIQSADPVCSPAAAAANDFDADTPRYSSRQDFSCWADR